MSATHDHIRPVTANELRNFADFVPDNIASHLLALADRHAKAEAAAHRLQAQNFLALIDGLGEYDSVVASHLLVSFLRIAAGQKLLSVEQTALRIAGLAETEHNGLKMTFEGKALLEMLSPDAPMPIVHVAYGGDHGSDAASGPDDAAEAESADAPYTPTAFANIRFGQRVFEVADGRTPGSLAFRLVGNADWIPLKADRSLGWDEIGGEILERGIDLTAEYVMMHTMRLAAPEVGAGVHHFELLPLNWWLRISGKTAELRIDGSDDWLVVPDDIREGSVRALGIRAAERLIPDFHARLQPEAIIWSRRMAHAAAVTPIMSSAA